MTFIGLVLLVSGLFYCVIYGAYLTLLVGRLSGRVPPEIEALLVLEPLIQFGIHRINFSSVLLLLVQCVLGLFTVVSGIGVLRLRPWAWLMALVVNGFSLLALLILYFRRDPFYLHMLIDSLAVLYLNQSSIRRAFRIAQRSDDPDSAVMAEATPDPPPEVRTTVSSR